MARSVPSIVSSNSNPRVFPSKPLAPMASLPSAPGRLSKTLAIPKSLHGLRKDFQPRSLSNELPLAGNLALDFEAEAVFDQEFSKALQYVQENPDEVCPAGWKPGERSMKPDPKLSKEYFTSI